MRLPIKKILINKGLINIYQRKLLHNKRYQRILRLEAWRWYCFVTLMILFPVGLGIAILYFQFSLMSLFTFTF